MFFTILLSALGLVALGVVVFVNVAPQIGGSVSGQRLNRAEQSPQFHDGKFANAIETDMSMPFGKMSGVMWEFIKGGKDREPDWSIPVMKMDQSRLRLAADTAAKITWFGHSAFLLEIDGKRLLLDPMFGSHPSPVSFMGAKRFNDTLPIEIKNLPHIDAALISHDHYDHLDYGSIVELKEKVGVFYMPLGVGAHLERWGVDSSKIHELDWWDKVEFEGLTFVSTPARHFSGRGLTNRFSTLWSSWVILGKHQRLFFSGDSGYFPGFKEIGEKYGPFDLTMMECGQYNEAWSNIHMMPEETVQAHIDVKGDLLMPIHWGAFTLALHTWTDPVVRVLAKAREENVRVITPFIGQTFTVGRDIPQKHWWEGEEERVE